MYILQSLCCLCIPLFVCLLIVSFKICEDNFLSFFFLSAFFSNIQDSQDSTGRGQVSINSSLPLLPTSQTFRHQPGNYCRELTSAHSQHPDSNREPLVSEHKQLTTVLCALASLTFCMEIEIYNLQKQSSIYRKIRYQNYRYFRFF